MAIQRLLRHEDVELWVEHIRAMDSPHDIRRSIAQLTEAACQMPPQPWQHPYAAQEAPFLYQPLPRDPKRMDEIYRNILVFFWQMYFPHYRVLLQRMANGQESMSLEQHLQYVQGNWFAAVLAARFLKAHLSRRPQWDALWLRTQMEYLGKTTWHIAQEYRLPKWQVRLAAWRYGLAPVRGWRGLLWSLGMYRPSVSCSTSTHSTVEEQVPFAQEIYLRFRGKRIFVPAREVFV